METGNEIKYKIKFYSDWHCGSGLAAGAAADALVIKDKEGLPYVPGKTIKGLIREAVIDLLYLTYRGTLPSDKKVAFEETFGYVEDDDNHHVKQGCVFFTNAVIPESEAEIIRKNHAQEYMFRSQFFTALQKDGIADEHSLRKIETVIPCELEGRIMNIGTEIFEEVKDALKMVKRLGIDRNRGLGRCQFIVENETNG